MSTNEWITDRLPTRFDGDEVGYVWVTDKDGTVCHMMWDCVTDQPWMHFTRPKPYVKPTRYVASRCGDNWGVYTITKVAAHTIEAVHASGIHTREAAERIAAIYEEVMP